MGFSSSPHVNVDPDYLPPLHQRDIHMSIIENTVLRFITVPQLADLTADEKTRMGEELRKYNEDEQLRFTVALGEVFPTSVHGTNDPKFQREWATPLLKDKGSIQKWFFVFGDRDVKDEEAIRSLTNFRMTSEFGKRMFLNGFEYLSVTAELVEDCRVYDDLDEEYEISSLQSQNSNVSQHMSDNSCLQLSENASQQTPDDASQHMCDMASQHSSNDTTYHTCDEGALDLDTVDGNAVTELEQTEGPPDNFWHQDFEFGLVRLLLLYSPNFSIQQQVWLEAQLMAYPGKNTIVLSHKPLSEEVQKICDQHHVHAVLIATEATPKSFTLHEIDTKQCTWTKTTHQMQMDGSFEHTTENTYWTGDKRRDHPYLTDPDAHKCCHN